MRESPDVHARACSRDPALPDAREMLAIFEVLIALTPAQLTELKSYADALARR
jgi:hypothetical protein